VDGQISKITSLMFHLHVVLTSQQKNAQLTIPTTTLKITEKMDALPK